MPSHALVEAKRNPVNNIPSLDYTPTAAMSESLTASTQSAQSTQAKDAPSTAGLALSPDPASKPEATASSSLNAKNVATPGELCGFVRGLGPAG